MLGCRDEVVKSFLDTVSLLKEGGTCGGSGAHIQGEELSSPKKDKTYGSPPVTVSAISVAEISVNESPTCFTLPADVDSKEVSPTKLVDLDSGEPETEVEETPLVKKSSRKPLMRNKKDVELRELGARDGGSMDKKVSPHSSKKRNSVADKEPKSSSKKQKRDLTESERKEILMSQKVLKGWVFYSEIANQLGMKEVIEIVEAKKWNHLFQPYVVVLFEAEVSEFYGSLLVTDGGCNTACLCKWH
ncbi:hypothetical protein RND71_042458 [Anisodus tanguticus]|uniref:Uncharacterized protein n=1 Tax=Anisodus tanguticus TaxID=243964 RepID=A0AAE1QQP9_9SOLA|nr:hypothetical protein RND71_042458 [Anisodus tanguticus]